MLHASKTLRIAIKSHFTLTLRASTTRAGNVTVGDLTTIWSQQDGTLPEFVTRSERLGQVDVDALPRRAGVTAHPPSFVCAQRTRPPEVTRCPYYVGRARFRRRSAMRPVRVRTVTAAIRARTGVAVTATAGALGACVNGERSCTH